MCTRAISSELQKKAEVELNEVPERIPEDINHIRGWFSQQAHLQNVKADDQLILNYLRGCKFSLQRTKEKLDMFYTMKSLLPEIYTDRDPFLPEIQEILGFGAFLPLRKTSGSDGSRIFLIRCKPDDPSKIIFANLVKVCIMIIDILLNEDDNFVIAGPQGLFDLKDVSGNHALRFDLIISRKTAICLQHAYPMRPKGFHCLNCPAIFEMLFNTVKPILTEKIKRRMNFYNSNNISDVYQAIPRNILPKEYGGDGDSLDELTDYWKNKVESYRNWFLEDAKNCSDETKRVGKPNTSANIFGVEGSFRKLNFD